MTDLKCQADGSTSGDAVSEPLVPLQSGVGELIKRVDRASLDVLEKAGPWVESIQQCRQPDQVLVDVHCTLCEASAALSSLLADNARLREALERIEAWEMPATGLSHDDGHPKSYGWCYGSNGERDVIRKLAADALSSAPRQGEEPGTGDTAATLVQDRPDT